jgi:hypothetical protein
VGKSSEENTKAKTLGWLACPIGRLSKLIKAMLPNGTANSGRRERSGVGNKADGAEVPNNELELPRCNSKPQIYLGPSVKSFVSILIFVFIST